MSAAGAWRAGAGCARWTAWDGWRAEIDDADEAALWAAAREGRFVLARCQECAAWNEPGAQRCARCAGMISVEPATGSGVVDSFLVVRPPAVRAFAGRRPSGRRPAVLALVNLEEGIRVAGRLDGLTPAEVTVGQQVQAALDLRPGTGAPTVVFRSPAPAMAAAGAD
ncbi:Putative nucleic-acid-binding protein containing a Zn-ribbon (fragment) [Frankia canadensis]|uniref:Nucleic-acid-binding protein containing a Zn-ribbon n=1 Tax=Frankia canadensis TaxID=1836972 RepID=A0A2I2KIM6_9ACTN